MSETSPFYNGPTGDNLAPAGQRPADPSAPSQAPDMGDHSNGLTAEEVAEFRALRQADTDRKNAAQAEADRIEREKPPVSHYLHLANGDVVESAGTMTHYHGIVVMNQVPIEDRSDKR